MLKIVISTRERKRDKRKARKSKLKDSNSSEGKLVCSFVARIDAMYDGTKTLELGKKRRTLPKSFLNYIEVDRKLKSCQPLTKEESSLLVSYQAYYGPIKAFSITDETVLTCNVSFDYRAKDKQDNQN